MIRRFPSEMIERRRVSNQSLSRSTYHCTMLIRVTFFLLSVKKNKIPTIRFEPDISSEINTVIFWFLRPAISPSPSVLLYLRCFSLSFTLPVLTLLTKITMKTKHMCLEMNLAFSFLLLVDLREEKSLYEYSFAEKNEREREWLD